MAFLVPAIALIALAMAAGFIGYILFYRYTDARAMESGLEPWQAHSGPTDGNGATAFERTICRELLLGHYQTSDPKTLKIGRASRRWTLGSVGLVATAIATLACAI